MAIATHPPAPSARFSDKSGHAKPTIALGFGGFFVWHLVMIHSRFGSNGEFSQAKFCDQAVLCENLPGDSKKMKKNGHVGSLSKLQQLKFDQSSLARL